MTAADRDRSADCLEVCAMAGRFLDELVPASQTDAVKKIMEMARMTYPMDLYIACGCSC